MDEDWRSEIPNVTEDGKQQEKDKNSNKAVKIHLFLGIQVVSEPGKLIFYGFNIGKIRSEHTSLNLNSRME